MSQRPLLFCVPSAWWRRQSLTSLQSTIGIHIGRTSDLLITIFSWPTFCSISITRLECNIPITKLSQNSTLQCRRVAKLSDRFSLALSSLAVCWKSWICSNGTFRLVSYPSSSQLCWPPFRLSWHSLLAGFLSLLCSSRSLGMPSNRPFLRQRRKYSMITTTGITWFPHGK